MQKIKYKYIFIGLIVLLTACEKENLFDLFKSTGDIVIEKREIKNFTSIGLHDRINLFLVQDTVEYLEIEAGENLLNSIDTKVNNGRLEIENNNRANFVRSYKKEVNATVHYKSLRSIIYDGAGSINTLNTMQSSYFEFVQYDGSGDYKFNLVVDTLRWLAHTGPGNATFIGKASDAYFYASGQSILHAENLQTINTSVNSAGLGDFYVNASISINAEIYFNGNVYYRGDPTSIFRSGLGEGQLIKLK